MKHLHDNARRHAYNTLAEVNRHLDTGKITNPRHHQILTDMAEKATRTLENLDRMDARMDTNDRYTSDARRYRANDANDMARTAMDVVDMLLPQLADNMDDYTDNIDDRRGRPRTTRRGVGRWTQVRRHVRRMPGRADMDDMYSDMDDDYNDDRYDNRYDAEARRRSRRTGRFVRGDMDRYDDADDARMTADDARRTADNAMRTADEARRTAEQARRAAHDNRGMDRYDNRTDARYDDRRDDRRDDRTDDRTQRPGPGGR